MLSRNLPYFCLPVIVSPSATKQNVMDRVLDLKSERPGCEVCPQTYLTLGKLPSLAQASVFSSVRGRHNGLEDLFQLNL